MSKYALITGGSSGIGKALAHEFARDGYNLVLVSRNEERLLKAADELKEIYPDREIMSIARDLTDEKAPQEIYDELKNKSIAISALVNNAGVGQQGEFVKTPLDKYVYIIRLNIEALTQLTHLFLSDMVRRNDGYILNLGSVAGFQPGPLMAVYHGSKAYVVSFSEAIAEELKDTNVTVTCLCPGPTDTEFFDKADMQDTRVVQKMKMMSPEDVAREAYQALMDKERIFIPGATNKVMTFMRRVMPNKLQAKTQKKFYEEVEEED